MGSAAAEVWLDGHKLSGGYALTQTRMRGADRRRKPTRTRPQSVLSERVNTGARIGFTEWTEDGRLRHPRYFGPRADKPMTSHAQDISRPDKVLFPGAGYTKADLAGRALVLHRFPDGIQP